jgi:hypothetical protein
MDKLFLLKSNFIDAAIEPKARFYYCPSCAVIEGVLAYYPHLREKLEVIYVDFPRPRTEIVDLLGEAHQGCPVLIIDTTEVEGVSYQGVMESKGRHFITTTNHIMEYLAGRYGVGFPHP